MKRTVHPSLELLVEHAAGSLSRGMSLLVATHAACCPACSLKIGRLEMLGGAVLRTSPPGQVGMPDLAETLARIETAPLSHRAPRRTKPEGPFPAPLQDAIGGPGASIRWRRLLPGLWDCVLRGDPSEDVRLVRARPGTAIPQHTHQGGEATLVLAGQLEDDGAVFCRGEASFCGSEDDHRPRAVGSDDCICLLVLTGRLRFTGPMGLLLNLLPQQR